MGDRANIQHIFPKDEGAISLYSHWGGTDAPAVCRHALNAANNDDYGQSRWDDPSYGLRLFLNALPSGWLSGVTPGKVVLDNEYPILVVDWGRQTVSVEAGPHSRGGNGPLQVGASFTFEEFAALPSNLGWD